jgi:O-antigen ligase
MTMRRIAYLLLLATLVTIPLEDVFEVPGIGTLARAFGLLAFVAWALSAFTQGSMRRPDGFHTFAFLLAIWAGLSLLWSLDTVKTLERIETYLQLLTLSLVVWDLCDSKRTIRDAMQALVIGMWLASSSVFINFAQGIESNYGRFSASGADPNYMSMMVAFGIPFAWYLALHSQRKSLRLLNLLYIPAAFLAMGLTGSRGGFVAGFVAIVYLLSTIRRLKPAGFIALLVASAAAVAAISAIVPETTAERVVSVGDAISEGDLNGRTEIWLEAWDAFVERPLAGIGAGASRAVLPSGKVPHSVAFTIGLELGIIGLTLFAGMVAASLRWAGALTRRDRLMWLAVVAIWATGAIALSLETRKLTWVLFSLLLGATVTARQSMLSGEDDDLPPAGREPAIARRPSREPGRRPGKVQPVSAARR